ncbi:MAG: TIGR00296 family protein, partial [Candidatus Bathyarchaeia archaeon]
MGFELSLDEGAYLVRLARRAIEAELGAGATPDPVDAPEKLRQPCGVFVTLNTVEGSSHRLRGCIGFPYPVKPLVEAVLDAARSAAFDDPRFRPVSPGEMGSIVVEVSVLTPPEAIRVESPDQHPEHIEVGVEPG